MKKDNNDDDFEFNQDFFGNINRPIEKLKKILYWDGTKKFFFNAQKNRLN